MSLQDTFVHGVQGRGLAGSCAGKGILQSSAALQTEELLSQFQLNKQTLRKQAGFRRKNKL